MNVSIILATHKRPKTLNAVLASFCRLEHAGIQWEVLVVDNAGGDEAEAVVTQYKSRLPVTLIVETHLGKSNALNTAMAKAKGALFLFTDDDIVVDSKWLVNMWEGVERWPDHSVFGGRILPRFPDGTIESNLKVDLEDLKVKACYAIADWQREEGEYHPGMLFGPNWAFKSELFRLGYKYRTDLGPGTEVIVGEETELGYRLYKAGFAPAYIPGSVVYHQIRQEQLVVRWVYRRVLKSGRSWVVNEGLPDVPLLFGVPRFLYRTVVSSYFKYLVSYFQRNQRIRFHRGLRYWFDKGCFYQFWKGLHTESEVGPTPRSKEKRVTPTH